VTLLLKLRCLIAGINVSGKAGCGHQLSGKTSIALGFTWPFLALRALPGRKIRTTMLYGAALNIAEEGLKKRRGRKGYGTTRHTPSRRNFSSFFMRTPVSLYGTIPGQGWLLRETNTKVALTASDRICIMMLISC
jgi:hypothetical protein